VTASALRVRDLRKVYDNGVEALAGIDLDVAAGEFMGLLGPNGAGKTTLIGILATLIRKSSGRVEVFGHDLDVDPSRLKARLGLVPQELNVNGFEPVLDILVDQAGYYGIRRRTALARAEQYLHQLGLWDKRSQLARRLSGGMRRRLMIARALMHRPSLLVLDEPTAGVDIEQRRSLWEFLRAVNAEGTTIILTTHYLEEAEQLCRRIGVIHRGHLIEHADTQALLRRLRVERFVLDLRTAQSAAPSVAGYALRLLDPLTLEVELAQGQDLNGLFSLLTAAGLDVVSMRNKANRLEERFIELVQAPVAGEPE
jgi:ABC-2 type transport system ATP-binding protein